MPQGQPNSLVQRLFKAAQLYHFTTGPVTFSRETGLLLPLATGLASLLFYILLRGVGWVFPPLFGALVAAILVPLFCYFLRRGRYLNLLLKLAEYAEEHLPESTHPVVTNFYDHLRFFTMLSFLFFKLFVSALLAYHGQWLWLAFTVTASSALAGDSQLKGSKQGVVPTAIWGIMTLVLLIPGGLTAVAYVVVLWLVSLIGLDRIQKLMPDGLPYCKAAMVEKAEWLWLLFGLTLIG